MTCICWVVWNDSGQLMLCCTIALAVLIDMAQEQLQHRSHSVSVAVNNQEKSATHKRAQKGCSPWACSSQCLRDCVVHARSNNCCNPRVVSTSTDPMEEYMALYLVTTKSVFFSCLKRHHSSSLKKSELFLMINPLSAMSYSPCSCLFPSPSSRTPPIKVWIGLVLVCSTNTISLTCVDIKFFSVISLISTVYVHFIACYYLSVTLWIIITFDASWDCDDTFLLTASYMISLFIPSVENREICGENIPSIYKTGCLISSQSPNITMLPHWNFWQYNQHRNQMWRSVTIMFLADIN